jgi:CheY-like chemotaxis protein
MQGSEVLLVEDDRDIREIASEILEAQGYRVVQAADGHEALRILRQLRPAVILLDLMMPRMSGWEVKEMLRHDPELASIPVIVMSAVERAGLPKPFGMEELLGAVGRVVPPRGSPPVGSRREARDAVAAGSSVK